MSVIISKTLQLLKLSSVRWCQNSSKPVLTFFTKKNEQCSLCDDAKEVLMDYSDQFVYEEIYIDEPANKEWFKLYRYDIPVLHLNGRFLMKHRINEKLLKNELSYYVRNTTTE